MTHSHRPFAPRPTTQITIGCLIIPLIVVAVMLTGFFYIRSGVSAQLTVPDQAMLLVRTAPDDAAPLVARFGQGSRIEITGRTKDWRWLEVVVGDGRSGWTLRPLDILVWQLDAPVVTPTSVNDIPLPVTPIVEEMVAIPATTFTMGSPPGLGEADEQPAHPVSLSAFEIDKTEVTLGQYWQCVEAGECAPPGPDRSQTETPDLNNPAFDNYPVVNIAWGEANRYCIWRGKRLPTEAEWEMAAGWDAGTGAKLQWPWGNDPNPGQANINPTSSGETVVVSTFAADRSPAGVLDMAGNVSEWVFDWYKVDYYRTADDADPTGPTHRRGEGSGRVVRGASFAGSLEQARTANRNHQEAAYGYPTVGFRCARDKE